MWVSKRKWISLLNRVERCEEEQRKIRGEITTYIRRVAKKILEQPEELLEEINGIENIESMINDFINS